MRTTEVVKIFLWFYSSFSRRDFAFALMTSSCYFCAGNLLLLSFSPLMADIFDSMTMYFSSNEKFTILANKSLVQCNV